MVAITKSLVATEEVQMGSGSKGQGHGPRIYEETVYGFRSSDEQPLKDIPGYIINLS